MSSLRKKINGSWQDMLQSGSLEMDYSPGFSLTDGLGTFPSPVSLNGATSALSMFASTRYPAYDIRDTSTVTNMGSMFSSSWLKTAPALDTSAATAFTSMFDGCNKLTSVPAYNAPSVTIANAMFRNCTALQTIPAMTIGTTSGGTSTSSMFNGCSSLMSFDPAFALKAKLSVASMFANCSGLSEIPAIDFTAATVFSGTFDGCMSVERIKAFGFSRSFSVANCYLGAEALNELFSNLNTVSGYVVTISGNPGAASCDRSIATAKGWNVSG